MNKYSVYIDLDSFSYHVEASDEDTARKLAVEAMEKYIAKHLNGGIDIADVVVDEDHGFLDDEDIELREGE
jgi:hypothetical protein